MGCREWRSSGTIRTDFAQIVKRNVQQNQARNGHQRTDEHENVEGRLGTTFHTFGIH